MNNMQPKTEISLAFYVNLPKQFRKLSRFFRINSIIVVSILLDAQIMLKVIHTIESMLELAVILYYFYGFVDRP